MSRATLPWVPMPQVERTRMVRLAQTLLVGGALSLLVLTLVAGLSLVWQPEEVSRYVLPITVAGPILVALGLPVIALLLRAVGLTRGGLLFSLFLAGGAATAGVVNYLILSPSFIGFDPYVFGFFTLLIAPALTVPLLVAGFAAVSMPYVVGRLLQRFAIFLFVGFVVVGLIVVPWLHALLFRYMDRLANDPVINTAAVTSFEGSLTIAELVTQFPDRQRVIAYALWPLQFPIVRDVFGLAAIMGFINIIPLFGIWWERKVAGRIQSRLGPMRVGGWHGWAQSFADGLKLIFKEDFIPPKGDPALFRLAPYLAFVPSVCAFVALPFGAWWVFRELDVALVFILAMLGIEVVGVIVAGWASNNKWSVYGAMREACQMVSYEIPMGMALLIPVMTVGTLNLSKIVDDPLLGQAGGFASWLAFRNPFCFAAALMYYIASLASCKRAPFDLPESESELVAGFHTEYSGFRWSLFFFAEYAAMFVVCGLSCILFFGGWMSPLPEAWGRSLPDNWWGLAARGVLFNGPLWFVLKSGLLFYVQLWIRWTLPRIRIDQVLYSCIQVMLPATMLLVLGNTFWILLEKADYGWFNGVVRVFNWLLTAVGAAALLGCLYWIVHGFTNRKRLVGTLVIDHLPGA